MAQNDSAASGGSPQQLLEAFIPGYSLISAFFMLFHIDITKYVAAAAVGVGILAGLRYLYSTLGNTVISYFICTAEIRPEDEMYNFLMAWFATQPFAHKSRQFVASASTNSSSIWDPRYSRSDDESDDEGDADPLLDEEDPRYWRAINSKEKMAPIYFTPGLGTTFFRYKGHFLSLNRQEEKSDALFKLTERSAIFISCLGRDPQVLKDLLDDARNSFFEKDESKTVIYRGSKLHGYAQWTKCMSRTSRPLSTVVIDEAQKDALLDDMKDYLHPATRRFYANRGIPYRRGYLLHGPPGTGKSSLSFALAGIFGLQLYIVNLNSKIDEDDLAQLFEQLPRKCLILLEDIDTAGVDKRADQISATGETEPEKKMTDRQLLEAAVKGSNNSHEEDSSNKKITLSALLNVIDGVASQEGRILVMTTNHVQKLDEALIRPGRVDMMVEFGYADAETSASLFRGMFSPQADEVAAPKALEDRLSEKTHLTVHAGSKLLTPPATPRDKRAFSPRRLHDRPDVDVQKLANEFGKLIPLEEFSPAQIQGFLLTHKRDPSRAVSEVGNWIEKTRLEKKKRESEEQAKKREAEEARKKEREAEEKKAEEEKEGEKKTEDKPEQKTEEKVETKIDEKKAEDKTQETKPEAVEAKSESKTE